MQNRFHIEHGSLSHAHVAFFTVIAQFILPFACLGHVSGIPCLSYPTAIFADSAKRTERRSFLIPIILFLDAKKMQTSAMKVYFQIAECSFFLFKENANERNESYFQIAECRFFFCKDNANRTQYKRITPFFLFFCSNAVCLCKVCPIHGQYKKLEE